MHEPSSRAHIAPVNDIDMYYETNDDMNFTPPYLSTITARTLIVHGDRDPLYPVNLALEMFTAIPRSCLWVIPNGEHGPIFGEYVGSGETTARFAEKALAFLRDDAPANKEDRNA